MFNPDFWEVPLEPGDLAKYSNEAGIWFDQDGDMAVNQERQDRQIRRTATQVVDLAMNALTERQRDALLLYYMHHKTQQEIAQILGISRRVVSQHLFGICRNGKHVGGAVNKMRKLCRQRGIGAVV